MQMKHNVFYNKKYITQNVILTNKKMQKYVDKLIGKCKKIKI